MPRNEEFDWIFDFALQFLESDKFDAAVMDFVDDKCFVFEDTEENKLVYTDIHKEFCEHVEALITSNLTELGISNELFLESCEKARDGRDINTTVFERLTAMDDFQTFKKIMTKRNTELQLESIKSFQVNTPLPPTGASAKNLSTKHKMTRSSRKDGAKSISASRSTDEAAAINTESSASPTAMSPMKQFSKMAGASSSLLDPEELQALKEAQAADLDTFGLLDDEEVQELLLASLMEMELIHRQEELEYAELERALQLSLAVEEQRLMALMGDNDEDNVDSSSARAAADSTAGDAKEASLAAAAAADSKSSSASNTSAMKDPYIEKAARADNFSSLQADSILTSSDPKPLLRPLKGDLKPLPSQRSALPSIGAGNNSSNVDAFSKTPLAALHERKRNVEDALKQSQQQIDAKRKQEEELREQLTGIDPTEAQRRAEHMKRQRELIIAKKKLEREKKVREEEERNAKRKDENHEILAESLQRLGSAALGADSKPSDEKAGPSEEEIAEMRRNTMRTALARRMKMELIANEEAKISHMQEEQYSELDKKLKQVEQLREDNRKREFILSKQLERQQAQIARNVRQSAADLARDGSGASGGGGDSGNF